MKLPLIHYHMEINAISNTNLSALYISGGMEDGINLQKLARLKYGVNCLIAIYILLKKRYRRKETNDNLGDGKMDKKWKVVLEFDTHQTYTLVNQPGDTKMDAVNGTIEQAKRDGYSAEVRSFSAIELDVADA